MANHNSYMAPQLSVYQSQPTASSTGPSASSPSRHQNIELVLYGSIRDSDKDQLLQRLRGLCEPGVTNFQEHNMCFKLKTGVESSPVQVQMRRRFQGDSYYWHCRYLGLPELGDAKCPVVVRKTIDSTIYSTNMMEFVKTLGLRMEYEYIAEGKMFTKGAIRVMVYKLEYTDVIGQYSKDNLKSLTDSHVIEAIIILPDGQPIEQPVKALREFCNQLAPLCDMQNVNYMRD